jgi:mono/diheme cytochrome c family protein
MLSAGLKVTLSSSWLAVGETYGDTSTCSPPCRHMLAAIRSSAIIVMTFQEDTIVLRRQSSLTCIKPSRGNGLYQDPGQASWQEDELQLFRLCCLFPLVFVAPATLAADADNGKRVAEMRCVPCHVVVAKPRREVADAPPFETIAGKFAAAPEMLAFSMLHPHPRMNLALTRREVEDISAYINTLAR